MAKKNILLLIPLLIITAYTIYTWSAILSRQVAPDWQHVTCICGVIFCWVLFSIDYKKALLGTGIFLLAGLLNILSLTPALSTFYIHMGGLQITFNLLCLGLLILYIVCNNVALVDIYLDWKEKKKDDASQTS